MTLPVLTAVTGAWEAPLVGGIERSRTGLVVVRRCADLTELLAAAAAGQGRAVLLSADLRRLDTAAVDRLAAARVAVVGLVDPDDDGRAADRLRRLGVRHVTAADTPPADLAALVEQAVQAVEEAPAPRHALADPAAALERSRERRAGGAAADGAAAGGAPAAGSESGPDAGPGHSAPAEPGRVVVVWGTPGAPGRTTVAATLAAELAALGEETLLVDADTHAASVAQVLGLLDESPGLAAACRAASTGGLDPVVLARLAPRVAPRLRVLTGISRAARWPELSAGALEEVLATARQVARWTVVDVAAAVEADEELSFDTAAPRRNAATLTALEVADTVLALGAADPVGLQRLVRALQDLTEAVPSASPRVVVTKVRPGAVGGSPGRAVTEALTRYAGVDDLHLVPDDRPGCDAALLAGRTLTEHVPGSPARAGVAALAAALAGRPAGGRRSRRAVRVPGPGGSRRRGSARLAG